MIIDSYDKINLIEKDIWKKNDNTITIQSCDYENDIVVVKLSNSLSSREYKIDDIQKYIFENNFIKS